MRQQRPLSRPYCERCGEMVARHFDSSKKWTGCPGDRPPASCAYQGCTSFEIENVPLWLCHRHAAGTVLSRQ